MDDEKKAFYRKGLQVVLLVIALVFIFLIVQQAGQLARLKTQAKTSAPEQETLEELKRKRQFASQMTEKKEQLRKMESAIPPADGYVWISRLIREANPRLRVAVDPPEMTQQEIIFAPEYCTGLFRIHGGGTMTDLLMLLRKIEAELPFAHVQELQFVYPDPKESRIDFNISLLAIMRLNEESSPNNVQITLH